MHSDTRPPAIEIERRKLIEEMRSVAGDSEQFRIKTAEALADIRAELKYGALWMEQHEKTDSEQFKELREKLGGVRSGVYHSEKEFTKLNGIKTGIGIATAVFLAIGGALWAIFTHFSAKP